MKVFTSFREILEPLSDAEKGRLFVAMLVYAESGETPEFSGNERFLWPTAKMQIDRAAKEYEGIVERNRENGKKGGRPKKADGFSENPNNPVGFLETQKSQDKDKDKDNLSLIFSNEKLKDNSLTIPNGMVCQTQSVRLAIEAWNTLTEFGIKGVSKVSSTSKRYQSLVARIGEHGIDGVLKAIEKIKVSNFLQGKNDRGWTATFDWFVLPNNFPKVLEGNYDNRAGGETYVPQRKSGGDRILEMIRGGVFDD